MGTRIALVITVAALSTLGLSACKDDGKDDPVDMPMDSAPPDPDADAAPSVCGDSATKGYLDVCTDASECGSCMCTQSGHDKICTPACTGPADCPAPSLGCAGGVCRPGVGG